MPAYDLPIAEAIEETKQLHQERYDRGLVRYSPKDRTIYLADSHGSGPVDHESGIEGGYYIPLQQDVGTPAGFVQVLARLREKAWFTHQMLDDFIAEFEVVAGEYGYNLHGLPDRMAWDKRVR